MIEKILAKAVENRLLVLILVVLLIGGGIYSWQGLATDAFPDASPVLVPIFVEVGRPSVQCLKISVWC